MNSEQKKIRQPLPPLDVTQRYRIPEAAAYLRHSVATTFRDIREGRLRVTREGARTFVPGSEIARRRHLDAAA